MPPSTVGTIPPAAVSNFSEFLPQLPQAQEMISLLFSGGSSGNTVRLGPAPWFRISGNYVRQGPHGTIAGTFHMHHWEVNAHHFPRYDCKEAALLHFEDAAGGPTRDFGPFSALYAEDGVMHADGKLFAKFIEETVLWHCFATETYWPALIIKPVPALLKA